MMAPSAIDGFQWHNFNAARSSLFDAPQAAGLIRTAAGDGGGHELVVRDLRAWCGQARFDLLEIAKETGEDPEILWTAPPAAALDAWLVAQMNGRQGMRAGRPRLIRAEQDLDSAPSTWGVYRIHRTTDDTWYVGISSNLRARLKAHRRNGMFDLAQGDTIELILAKDPDTQGVTTWSALQKAESLHIRRLRDEGKSVINVTGGGNGHPPLVRFNAQVQEQLEHYKRLGRHLAIAEVEIWHKVDADTEMKIPGSEYPVVNLHMTWSDEEGDWGLYLERRAHIMALAPGTGPIHEVRSRTHVPLDWLKSEYAARRPGRVLDDDLQEMGEEWCLPEGGDLRFFMHKRKLHDDAGREQTDPRALAKVTQQDIKSKSLPPAATKNGFVVDPSFVQSNSLNSTIRVHRPGNSDVYLKTEENGAAVRAEKLVSLLWYRLGWPGLSGRVTTTDDGALVIPALGAGGIQDLGNFNKRFPLLPGESASTLRSARAWTIKRVSVRDLGLRDPMDVVRFVILNAVTGNTDRHARNLHFGRAFTGRNGENGYLLPLDHGRCIFNNDNGRSRKAIAGRPADAVTGAIGNPHQLLRAFTELVREERRQVKRVATETLDRLGAEIGLLKADPAWRDYMAELDALLIRAAELAEDLDRFLDECTQAVIQ